MPLCHCATVARWRVAATACQTNEACFGITKRPVPADAAVITGDKNNRKEKKCAIFFFQKSVYFWQGKESGIEHPFHQETSRLTNNFLGLCGFSWGVSTCRSAHFDQNPSSYELTYTKTLLELSCQNFSPYFHIVPSNFLSVSIFLIFHCVEHWI